MATPWYRGLPAVRASVDCSGRRHHVSWRRGRLLLEDHDLAAEAALRALGGDPPACLAVLDRWRELCRLDLSLGGLHGRGPAPLPARAAPPRPAACEGMPEPLVDVLMAAWTVHAGREHPSTSFPAVPELVRVTLQRRAQAALRQSLEPARRAGASTPFEAAVGPMPAGGEPQVDIEAGPRVVRLRLRLPTTWLVETGATGAALGDAFLLRRRGNWAVAVRWEEQGRRLCPTFVDLAVRPAVHGWLVVGERPARGGAFWSVRTSR